MKTFFNRKATDLLENMRDVVKYASYISEQNLAYKQVLVKIGTLLYLYAMETNESLHIYEF